MQDEEGQSKGAGIVEFQHCDEALQAISRIGAGSCWVLFASVITMLVEAAIPVETYLEQPAN